MDLFAPNPQSQSVNNFNPNISQAVQPNVNALNPLGNQGVNQLNPASNPLNPAPNPSLVIYIGNAKIKIYLIFSLIN